jgi:hypothetical protein
LRKKDRAKMYVSFRDDGVWELGFLGKVWLRGLDLYLRRAGKVLTLRDFQAGPWSEEFREGRRIWRRRLSLEDEEILEIRVREEDQVLRIEAEFLTEFSELQGSLDYTDPAVVFPVFLPAPELSYFLCTFGLDGAAGGISRRLLAGGPPGKGVRGLSPKALGAPCALG